MIKMILKIVLAVVLLIALILGGIILYAQMTDFRPDEKMNVEQKGATDTIIGKDTLTFFNWNIGYSGLGAEMDFFYDGGENVITPKDMVAKYFDGIKKNVGAYKGVDFMLLQEVDVASKRSHRLNQMEGIASLRNDWSHTFGKNYDVKFVPLPFSKPMGKVKSGLLTLTPFKSTENTRYQFPGNFSWPKGLFFLDRCFLLQRFAVKNGKELIVINTHNSAYDDGTLKKQQMEYLKKVLMAEYEKGNYVIVGGDWNQNPPGFDNKYFEKKGGEAAYEQVPVSFDYMPQGWLWAYDPDVPTNRKVSYPYDPAKTFTTIIDFYLLSPNVKLNKVKSIDLDFQFSDHQPVTMEIVLQPQS